MGSPQIITIDGPSASGKSSVSRMLAARLSWNWVSTGAFYRGLALVALKEGLYTPSPSTSQVQKLVELAHSSLWRVRTDSDLTRVFYKDQDVTFEVHAEENAQRASQISQIPEVRAALLTNQRDCLKGQRGLVAEGRDCGTVVFPNAVLKVYLTASQEERAARRAREQGLNVEHTQSQQIQRDKQDSSRTAAPLQIPADAKVIDSNGMTLEQVVEILYGWSQEALAQSVKSF